MDEINEILSATEYMPIIPLRGLVVYPKMFLHFDVGRKKSINALNAAMDNNQLIFLVSQRDSTIDSPSRDDIFRVGVVCRIKKMIKIPNSKNLSVVVEGIDRAIVNDIVVGEEYFSADVSRVPNIETEMTSRLSAYVRAVKKEYEIYASMFKKISNEVVAKIIETEDMGELSDYICENSFFSFKDKQDMLESIFPDNRIKSLLKLLRKENLTLDLESEIQ